MTTENIMAADHKAVINSTIMIRKSSKLKFVKLTIACVIAVSVLTGVHGVEETGKTFSMLMPDVQPLVKETYLCTSFKMPKLDFQYIVGFTPNASQHTAHHILIYGCEAPGFLQRDSPRFVWDCGEMSGSKSGFQGGPTCSSGSQIIYAWAKDAPPLQLPEGVGFKVGKSTGINHLVLQVHYAHVDAFVNGGTDNSGIILSLLPSSTDKVTKSAGVLLLGTGGMIPAEENEYMESACKMNEPLVVHPFAFRTHTHALGKAVSGYKIDKNGEWHLIGKHNPQEPQMFYPTEKDIIIEAGDVVASRCTMYNFRDRDTFIGSTAEDEMCNFYMMYYVDGDRPLTQKYCFSDGPPRYYWQQDHNIDFVPSAIDESASRLD